jgi:transcriptional regulator GlxA family with amidase domain
MRQNLDKPLPAASLASQASMSLSHFFALFKRQVGTTPIDYLIHLRMERARDLLTTTDLSVKEIAAALGYDDPFYFSRVFKSVNGVAPTDFRQKNKPVIVRAMPGGRLAEGCFGRNTKWLATTGLQERSNGAQR